MATSTAVLVRFEYHLSGSSLKNFAADWSKTYYNRKGKEAVRFRSGYLFQPAHTTKYLFVLKTLSTVALQPTRTRIP